MKTALILGASGGIGAALCAEYEARGCAVTGLSRRDDGFDITDPVSVETHLTALDQRYDYIICATGQLAGAGHPPEKSLKSLSAEAMMDQFRVNAMGPALIMRHVPQLLPRDRSCAFAVLSARVGSIGDNQLGGWYSYRAAKAAVNQLLRGASIELRRSHPKAVLMALHPGTVDTSFTANFKGRDKLSPAQAAQHLAEVIDRKTPEQSGQFYDWADTQVPW
ncbi:MAG: SDR family NAD(P)-dependent oxidoreductase [Paracoccaceae bacterium]